MAARDNTSENHLAKFFGLVALTVAPLGVSGALLFIRHNAVRDTESARSWVETPCVIEKCEFGRGTSGDSRRTLDIVYRYEIEGMTYRGDRLDLLSGSMGDDDVMEDRVHATYPPGTNAVCYVNWSDPTQSVFDRDHAAQAAHRLWLLAFPFACAGLGFCYLLLTAWTEPRRGTPPLESGNLPALPDPGPPPRKVPLLGGAVVLAGPASAQLAWLFVVAFLFVFVILDGPASYARLFTGRNQAQVTGRIIDARVRDQRELNVSLYQYTFTYPVGDQAYTGQSFTRGKRFAEGADVTVTYDPTAPAKGSIAGTRPSSFTWWHSLIPLGVLFLLALGLGGMYYHSARAVWLYRYGQVARAHCMKSSSSMDPNHDMATLLSDLYFEIDGRRYKARRYSPDKKGRTQGSADSEPPDVYVLYNPRFPKRNVIIDDNLQELTRRRRSVANCLAHCAPPVLAIAAIAFMFLG